ncbi:NAD(P)H-dependent flavin oxidoreductase [Desulfoluna spongiiphila]|uniref:Nitronate monooxygenase n=1 Tax=Desulfoluna spongiiphila TaxID=419481 RepID=A0A1G5E8X5_9BACT|nr:nitronate monooxygenase [Desulfoluna spongiiphila]SCY23160.1 nitronate monooxygenase [Desulfoluna spongiiphila]VVS91649.1 aldolase-type tim barrel [Desulfoluna spongiiphila]
MKTRMTDLFGCRYPIQCGGMLWIAKPSLAAAISNAGALGNLTSGNYNSADELRTAIDETRQLTRAPFIVNITTMPSIRLPVELLQDFFRVCCEKEVTALEIAGAPVDRFLGPEFIPMAKEAGVKVLHKVGTVKHAVHAQKVGYDAVTIAGFEEGGFPHKDNVSTLVLVPRVVSEVDIPVLAAGGMANGRSLAAALSLGADGIMMATRFLATRESEVHPNIHKVLVDKKEYDTSLNLQSLLSAFGLQVRALSNTIMKQVADVEHAGGDLTDLLPLISGERAKAVWKEGNAEEAMLTIGQSVGLVEDIPTVGELMERMIAEARESLDLARGLLSENEGAWQQKSSA